ncbi:nitrous oxide reductase accessory protein NosL [Macrococcoides caseolyticum]|uniref:nitrous oxide reductase accessory protein NosL n=1 Tax=Macrococcoides caseolyticum TaxID=69966 RepID=UPI001F46593B|nr:nitrous oxide reductase accessory protein NosL [Macrococcus caseolyticus]MCE4957987.1 nitrous oxide reductase accessory protein NosL [Macrococcus caseolyticus]
MKRVSILLSTAIILTACGGNETSKQSNGQKSNDGVKTEQVKVDQQTVKVDGYTLKEPQEDTKCAACNMKVYQKSDALGKYSAQAIGEDGKNYFFDDLFCLLNYERKSGKKMKAKFVRDYKTLEWINVSDAKFVKGEIKTPMNVGIASFKAEEDAQKFAHQHDTKVEALKDIDKKAMMRFMEKQKQMKDMKKSDEKHETHHE